MTVKNLQVEVSTVCDASCIYCPHTIFSNWKGKFIDLSLFKKIVNEAYEIGVEYLHLQGWGEPLLHPQFLEMLSFAKKYLTGFTTNGKFLTPNLSKKILDVGIDIIAVTFAGATAETHNKIRRGNDFDVIVNNLKNFVELTKTAGKPRVVAIYMMLKNTVAELPKFVELAASIGVDEVKLSNISYVPNLHVWKLRAFSEMYSPEPPAVVDVIKRAKEVASAAGIRLSYERFSPWEYAECPEAPTTTLFINVNGDVSPCVFLNIPAEKPTRCFEGRCEPAPRLVFGNVTAEPLKKIIEKGQYKEFTGIFERRKRDGYILPEPPEVCKKCYRLYWI